MAADWTAGHSEHPFHTDLPGDCADESEAFYNVGDGVPGSEVPLEHAESWDVSAARPVSWHNGHLWPTQYYLQQAQQQHQKPITPVE